MKWEHGGLISVGHRAQVPVVDMMEDRWRIHYSTRDSDNRSIPLWVDVEPGTCTVLGQATLPTITLGNVGCFDAYGVMPSGHVKMSNGKKFLYYVGWSRRHDVPYHNATGVAISDDNGLTYTKMVAPILAQSFHDPYFTGTLCALKQSDGTLSGWYMSCTGWSSTTRGPEALYQLRRAWSAKGLEWQPLAFEKLKGASGQAICQASVIETDQGYEMWFSYRGIDAYKHSDVPGLGYRIGHASTTTGGFWKCDEGPEFIPSRPFNDHMQAYPFVIWHGDELYMFYNGNEFGRDGILWCTQKR